MSSQQLDEEAIFHVARGIPESQLRSTYLDQACAGDFGLRERVEALLEVHENEQAFLKSDPDAAPTVDHAPLTEHPGTTIGRYKLMEQIGEGGMGTVFVAEQERPIRRKVALKVIKPGMDSKAVVARFEAERQALALMDHPNIAKVLDAGTTDSGRPYFVMELVRGIPITEYCDQHKLTIRERLELFTQVCQAIQHAHQKAIIHRDIKPTNVLVTEQDGKPVPKVIDFGVAKALNQRLTERTIYTSFAQVVGTPLYMSPEQAALSNVDVDTRSDVYSLGVLLYEVLTGTTPFDRDRFEQAAYDEIRRIVREEEPPKPSAKISTLGKHRHAVAQNRRTDSDKLGRAVRGDLDWIVMKSLSKERSRRYQSPSGFAEDISDFLASEPVTARPPTLGYRATKYLKRNRAAIAVLGLLFASLSLGLLGTAWQARIALHQAKTATENEREANRQRKVAEDALIRERSANVRLSELYFREAMAAAMSGNDSIADATITEAMELKILTPLQIDMLKGQRSLYSGDTRSAFKYLRAAAESDSESILPRALLATACALGMAQQRFTEPLRQAEELQRQRLASGQVLDPLEVLFLAQAQLYQDPKLVDATLRELPKDYSSPLADAIRADVLTHLAHDYHDEAPIRDALSRLDRAQAYMPENAYVSMVNVWAHLVALRIIDETASDYEQLRDKGLTRALALSKHQRFPVANSVRAMFLYEHAPDEAVALAHSGFAEGSGFMFSVIRYWAGDTSFVDELRALMERSPGIFTQMAFAHTVAFDPNNEETIRSLYDDVRDDRVGMAKWFTPETLLLLQRDNDHRKRKCDECLRDLDELLTQWEKVAIQLIGETNGVTPRKLVEAAKDSLLEQSRSHFIIGIQFAGKGDEQLAERHLSTCEQMKIGLECYWAKAYLASMRRARDAGDRWPTPSTNNHRQASRVSE